MNRVLKFWTALLFLFSGAMLLWFAARHNSQIDEPQAIVSGQQSDQVVDAAPIKSLKHFELQDQLAQKFNSKQLAGKIWVGSVFFSSCPSTCRMQNMRVAKLQQEFGDDGVRFVSITCDPERDTVAALAEYSQIFGAKPDRWHFLTGDFDLIQRIGNEKLGIVVQPETHSDRLVLFDRKGEKVGAYRSTQTEEFGKIREHISKLLTDGDGDDSNEASIQAGEVGVNASGSSDASEATGSGDALEKSSVADEDGSQSESE